MEKTAFRFDSYRFVKASLNFEILPDASLEISFFPKGEYHPGKGEYRLYFETKVTCPRLSTEVMAVSCVANFSFEKPLPIEQIPDFFYPNSLAIVFPYVRAFVSTLSLQANIPPIVLPTLNLMGLKEELHTHTQILDSDGK